MLTKDYNMPFCEPQEEFGTVDVLFVPYLERMRASLFYYKGFNVTFGHPRLLKWFKVRVKTIFVPMRSYNTNSMPICIHIASCTTGQFAPQALETRESTYRGMQGDFHTHSHDLPPQLGGCCRDRPNSGQVCTYVTDSQSSWVHVWVPFDLWI